MDSTASSTPSFATQLTLQEGTQPASAETLDEPGPQDKRLAANVRRALGNRRYRDFRQLEVAARDGIVALAGSVSSFYLKQVAQTIAKDLPGVRRVVNDVEFCGR